MARKEYISINSTTNSSEQQVKLTNAENEFTGKIMSNKLCVNEFDVGMFIEYLRNATQNINQVEDDEYTLSELKDKFNNLLETIKDALETATMQEDTGEPEGEPEGGEGEGENNEGENPEQPTDENEQEEQEGV